MFNHTTRNVWAFFSFLLMKSFICLCLIIIQTFSIVCSFWRAISLKYHHEQISYNQSRQLIFHLFLRKKLKERCGIWNLLKQIGNYSPAIWKQSEILTERKLFREWIWMEDEWGKPSIRKCHKLWTFSVPHSIAAIHRGWMRECHKAMNKLPVARKQHESNADGNER